MLIFKKKIILVKSLTPTIIWSLTVFFLQAQTHQFFSQDYFVEQYTNTDGLPGNSVKDILLDQNGFLWFATHQGLVRYDGFEFEQFLVNTASDRMAYSNFVYTLYEDQSGLIWAGTLNEGLYVFDPRSEKVIRHFAYEKDDKNSLCSDWVRHIIEDYSGNIWVSSLSGLNKIDRSGNAYFMESFQAIDSSHAYEQVHQLRSDRYVLGNLGGRLHLHDSTHLWHSDREGIDVVSFKEEVPDFELVSTQKIYEGLVNPSNLTILAQREDGRYWLSGKYKAKNEEEVLMISLWDPQNREIININHQIPADTRIEQLHEDARGHLWIGTWGRGLYLLEEVIDDAGQIVNSSPLQKYIPLAPGQNKQEGNIWKLFPDQFGNLWVGTWRGHLFKIHLSSREEAYFRLLSKKNELFSPGKMVEDSKGNLWITTSQNGFFRYQKKEGELSLFDLPLTQTAKTVNTPAPIAITQNDILWIGTFHGLYKFDIYSEKLESIPLERKNQALEKDWVNALCYSEESGLFCGTSHGSIYRFDEEQRKFEAWHEEYTNLGVINDLLVTSDRHLLASTSKGIHRIKVDEPTEKTFFELNGGALDLFESRNKKIWLGTYLNGLNQMDLQLEVEKRHLQSGSTSPSWITGISEDAKGFLWLIGPDGIFKFSPEEETIETFSQLSHFPLPKVSAVTGLYKSNNGRLYVGAETGVFSFLPEKMEPRQLQAVPLVKNLLINNQVFRKDPQYEDLQSALYLKKIRLPYSKNDVAIEYVGLQFDYPKEVEYRYRLEGFQKEWLAVGKERIARFPNLKPGNYTFRLQARNGDGVWSEQQAHFLIRILPPWWRTIWAYIFYVFAVGLLAYSWYNYLVKRKLAVAEADRLRELNEVKTKLYTNITHEFRTPLTVIQGMAGQSLKFFQERSFQKMEGAVEAIQRNSRGLLRLVNQMLDLSKMEAGALQLNLIQGDVINFLKYLSESFHSYAQGKNIQFTSYTEEKTLKMDYDPDKIHDIFSNLISNAIKFTPSGGKVVFHTKKEDRNDGAYLVVKIQDSGIGISAEKIPHIFDRFYQVDDVSTRKGEGTGIGLAHTKELVHLMGGEIQVDSQLGEGSTFTVMLPITKKAAENDARITQFVNEEIQKPVADKPHFSTAASANQPTILIVEDNQDVRTYLQSCLEEDYHLIFSFNGHEGIEKAKGYIPDVIISDVMMPEKNGFELCETLKSAELTSHIPIILLTAKADDDARLEGLGTGADAYLIKPFNQEELNVRLRQLIKLRKRLQKRYQKATPIKLDPSGFQKKGEDPFIRKVQLILETHLNNENLNVSILTQELGMSRSQLFRKLKAVTGLSAVEYIRSYRMHRAEELLKNTSLSISEVAYSIGFKDPAYFSRVFSTHFGHSPSETRK